MSWLPTTWRSCRHRSDVISPRNVNVSESHGFLSRCKSSQRLWSYDLLALYEYLYYYLLLNVTSIGWSVFCPAHSCSQHRDRHTHRPRYVTTSVAIARRRRDLTSNASVLTPYHSSSEVFSASEVTNLRRYTNLFITKIISRSFTHKMAAESSRHWNDITVTLLYTCEGNRGWVFCSPFFTQKWPPHLPKEFKTI